MKSERQIIEEIIKQKRTVDFSRKENLNILGEQFEVGILYGLCWAMFGTDGYGLGEYVMRIDLGKDFLGEFIANKIEGVN